MMKRVFHCCGRWLLVPAFAGAVLFTWSAAAWAQSSSRSSSGGSGSSGGGFTGGSSGSGFTGGSGGSGFTGGSGGSSFSGSSGGSSFSGTSSGFTGSQSLNTSTGGGGGGGRGGSSSTNTGPSQSNPWQAYYGNPQAMGMGTNGSTTVSKPAFGQALYKINTTTGTTGTGNYGGGRSGSSLSGYAGASTSNPVTGSTMGMRRDAFYASTVDFARTPITPLAVRGDLQQVIARSTSLPSKDNINVMADGSVVVLQGTVANERERRQAEGLVRLTPGVYDVRNELQVGAVQARTADAEKKP